jgi:membrane protease YdiL (CAAX protease family)
MSDSAVHRQTIVYLAILVEGGLIFLSWIVGWLLNQSPLLMFQWTWQDVLLGVGLTLPMAVIFFGCYLFPVGPLGQIKRFVQEVFAPLMAPCTLVDLLGISILAGLGEEMLFRGVLQSKFILWAGVGWGVAIASVLFGLLHAVTPAYTVLATLMGAYLGVVFWWTNNLLVVVLMHALYDFLALVYLLHGPNRPVLSPPEEAEEEGVGSRE